MEITLLITGLNVGERVLKASSKYCTQNTIVPQSGDLITISKEDFQIVDEILEGNYNSDLTLRVVKRVIDIEHERILIICLNPIINQLDQIGS